MNLEKEYPYCVIGEEGNILRPDDNDRWTHNEYCYRCQANADEFANAQAMANPGKNYYVVKIQCCCQKPPDGVQWEAW